MTYVNLNHNNHIPGIDDIEPPNNVQGLQLPLAPQAQLYVAAPQAPQAPQGPLELAAAVYNVNVGATTSGYNDGINSVSVFTQTEVCINNFFLYVVYSWCTFFKLNDYFI